MNRKTEFERRVVEDWEYRDLVHTLLNPPPCHKFGSRKAERLAIGRDAADAVRLLRQTGGRLNEILRLRLDQFHWSKGFVRLEATKTENERDIPLWGSISEIVQARIGEGLTGDGYLFARAKTPTYDNAIARACRNAGKSPSSTTAGRTVLPATASGTLQSHTGWKSPATTPVA